MQHVTWRIDRRSNENQLAGLRDRCRQSAGGYGGSLAPRLGCVPAASRFGVPTSGRGPVWAAAVTATGRGYLERVASPHPPVPRQASVSVTQQLVDAVVAVGGALRVPRRRCYDREGGGLQEPRAAGVALRDPTARRSGGGARRRSSRGAGRAAVRRGVSGVFPSKPLTKAFRSRLARLGSAAWA